METKPQIEVNFKQKYLDLFTENTKSSMKFIMDDPQAFKEFGDAILNYALDLDGPHVMNRKPSPTNIFIANTLMKPFNEIWDSYDHLTHIRDYIRIYPYKKYGISNSTYLRYHIGNYFNNIYILRERLKAYLNKIDKAYRNSTSYNQVQKCIVKLKPMILSNFKTISCIRNNHVHEEHFEDKDIGRLKTLELLTRNINNPKTIPNEEKAFNESFNIFKDQQFREARKKWINILIGNIRSLDEFLENYFENLYNAITKNDKIIIPEMFQNPPSNSKHR
jgi:hypothetical protein